jgi:recombinational DNA repair protein (RecF pathway)
LALIERCPLAALATVLCGLEWRFLLALGLQPEVDVCAETGARLSPRAQVVVATNGRGFVPRAESAEGMVVAAATRDALRQLGDTPGKGWPALALAPATVRAVTVVLGRLVAAAIERVPRARGTALRALG